MPPTRTHLAKGYGYTTAGNRTADTTYCGRQVVDATLSRSMDGITCAKCAYYARAYLDMTMQDTPHSRSAWGQLCRNVEWCEVNIVQSVAALREAEQNAAAYAAGDRAVRLW